MTSSSWRFVASAALGVVGLGACASSPSELNMDCDLRGRVESGLFTPDAAGLAMGRSVVAIDDATTVVVDDVTAACRAIALELGVVAAPDDFARPSDRSRDRMARWCKLALDKLSERRGSSSVHAAFTPVVCGASVATYTACRAACRDAGDCDVHEAPPRCDGGKMRANCMGHCRGAGGAPVECVGLCVGSCQGSCTTAAPADCAGVCYGACDPASASGACNGKCTGTCSAARGGACSGTCEGACAGSCDARGSSPAQCDGACDGPSEPLECRGGKLTGGCDVSDDCALACERLAQAKLVCPAPVVAVTSSSDRAESEPLIATLEKNLPALLAARARAAALGDPSTTLADRIAASDRMRFYCVSTAVGHLTAAKQDLAAARSAVDGFQLPVSGL